MRGMAVWALGRLASVHTIIRAKKTLVQVLQDPYFKVRASACTALAQFGSPEVVEASQTTGNL